VAVGRGGPPAVARGQAQGVATRDPPGRNPGGCGAAGRAGGVSGPRSAPARTGRLNCSLSRKVQPPNRWFRVLWPRPSTAPGPARRETASARAGTGHFNLTVKLTGYVARVQ